MENKTKSESITLKNPDIWKYSMFAVIALLLIGAYFYYSNSKEDIKIIDGTPVNIELGNAPVKGAEDAKITFIEFSDYECPYCGRNFLQTYPQIMKNYVDTGKVKIAFKDFPLAGHSQAQKASEAAECVKAQLGDGGYWKMHDKLYSNQQSLSIENYKKWAREIGVDGMQFDSDLDSGKYANDVKSDFSEGRKAGVKGTPAFFVNGKPIIGACPYSTFSSAFDAELAGKNWSVKECEVSIN